MSVPVSSATRAMVRASCWNCSLRATKSVSELISTTTPLLPASATATRPSAATRPDFFAAFDRPFLRSQSTAASTSPPVSVSAVLQSIMPAPVLSRSSFTIAALMLAIVILSIVKNRVLTKSMQGAARRQSSINTSNEPVYRPAPIWPLKRDLHMTQPSGFHMKVRHLRQSRPS
ncbi:hypothetical protein CHELA41_23784 [Hyphomicrobiales bacterium]|nr:hypothetical protein CHELA41_23784 [Hyphomicrobiales bacterium]